MANEKRLVNAEAIARKLKNIYCAECNVVRKVQCSACWVEDVLELLEGDTVDTVEVVHSEWTLVIDENDCECIECPLCGEQFYDGDNDTFDKPYNYCPNCGAKMDGDGNEID